MFAVLSFANDTYYFLGIHEGTEDEVTALFPGVASLTLLAWVDRREAKIEPSPPTVTISDPKDANATKPESVLDAEAAVAEAAQEQV